MSMSLELRGLEQVKRGLKGMAGKNQKKALRKGSRAGAKIIQKEAKQNAPVRSGALKKNIKVRATKRSRKWVGSAVQSFAGTEAFYGWFVEAGTENMRPREFMLKSSKSKKQQVLDTFSRITLEEIKKLKDKAT